MGFGTRYKLVDEWSPKGEAIVEGTALVFLPKRLETDGSIDTASARGHITGDEVVKGHPNPLSGRSSS